MPDLLVAPCTYEAAKHAVMHWHYSQAMPRSKLVTFGVWEDGQFIGAVIYGRGGNHSLLKPYGLDQTEGCELVRVALRRHAHPVTQIVAQSLTLLKHTNPGLRLVVSFADPEQGHVGGIYQAGNWLYLGQSSPMCEYIINGKRKHNKTVSDARKSHRAGHRYTNNLDWAQAHVDPNAVQIVGSSKYRYVYPLDKPTRRRLTPNALPYPHAEEVSEAIHHPTRVEGQVQSLDSAPNN